MALEPKVFGIAANTVSIDSGPTGFVVETFDIDASSTEKDLTGNNPGQTVIDVRTTGKKETATFTAEFEAYVEPEATIGQSCTFGASSDTTGVTGAPSASAGVTGKVVACKLTGHKGDWWQYNMTVVKVPASS